MKKNPSNKDNENTLKSKQKFSTNKPIALSWSGGKDSCLLLHKAVDEKFKVKYLVNFINKKSGGSMSSPFNKKIIQLQAKSIGLPLMQIDGSNKKKVIELIYKTTKENTTIGMNYLYSTTRNQLIPRIINHMGGKIYNPFFLKNSKQLLKQIIDKKIVAMIIGLNCQKLDKRWLGKIVNERFFQYLNRQKDVDSCGENGEYQTVVLDCPLFKKRISIQNYKIINKYHHLSIVYPTKFKLLEKNCHKEPKSLKTLK